MTDALKYIMGNMQPEESARYVKYIRDEMYPTGPLNSRLKAFEITKRVALGLAHLGYGIVRAKSGSENNADGFTCDIIAKRDGFHVDILYDGEGVATPTWQEHYDADEMAAIRPRFVSLIPPSSPPEEPEDEDDGISDREFFDLLISMNDKLNRIGSEIIATNQSILLLIQELKNKKFSIW